MKFQFKCCLCKKEVKRGDKFQVSLDQYDTNFELHGVCSEDEICLSCAQKIERKINSLRRMN